MTGNYNEETLQPLNKTQLIRLLLKNQEQTNNTINTLTEEIKEIHHNFKKLESQIIVVRRECVQVVGIPSSVEHDQLEPILCRILHHIGVNISGDKIEACHQLDENSEKTIVKFSSRKDCEHKVGAKKDLKDLATTDLDLPARTKLYINDSLCLYYRVLWNEIKKLWSKKKIFSYFTVSGTVRIKLQEKGPYSIITRIDDLKKLFPDENFLMF